MQYMLRSFHEYSGTGIIDIILMAAVLFIWLFFLVIFQIIMHEGGHFIFGWLSGLRFLSIRIWHHTLINTKGKLSFKTYSSPGSLGQCLMIPTQSVEKSNIVLYFLGGIITDAVIGLLSCRVAFGPLNISLEVRCGFMITAFYTIGSALINGLPVGCTYSDGYNTYAYIKDKQAMKSSYTQLYVLYLMQTGYTYGSLDKETVTVPEGADLTNPLIVSHKFIECYHYMDLHQWDTALDCIIKLEEALTKGRRRTKVGHKESIISVMAEKLYIYIRIGKNASDIEALYDSIEKVLDKRVSDFQLFRVRMAYDLYKDRSSKNLERIKTELLKKRESYPYLGDADFCAGLILETL